MSKLQDKPSALKKEPTGTSKKRNLFFSPYACGSFWPSWIRIWIQIAYPDLDPERTVLYDYRASLHKPATPKIGSTKAYIPPLNCLARGQSRPCAVGVSHRGL